MAPTTPQAAVSQAGSSPNPRAGARLAMSHAPTKKPNAMPTPCGENCTGPMPILGMTFQPIMAFGVHPIFFSGALRGASAGPIGEAGRHSCDNGPSQSGDGYNALGKVGLGWEGMTDDLCDLRAVPRSEGPCVC